MPPVGLGLMLLQARNRLRDLSVRVWTEPALIYSANEGKNELCKLLRHTREDYFLTSSPGNIPVSTPGNPSEAPLPADFAEFKDIEPTTPGMLNVIFSPLDRADPAFREAVVSQPPVTDGSVIYYDIVANAKIQFAPGLTSVLAYKLYYIQYVPDMAVHTDVPSQIPTEHWDFIVNWMVVDALRAANDPRYQMWSDKLKMQTDLVVNAAQQRRVAADPKFARGYDED